MKIFHTALSVPARERHATRVRLPMRFRGRKSSPNREIDRDRAPASASAATIISIVTLTSCEESEEIARSTIIKMTRAIYLRETSQGVVIHFWQRIKRQRRR